MPEETRKWILGIPQSHCSMCRLHIHRSSLSHDQKVRRFVRAWATIQFVRWMWSLTSTRRHSRQKWTHETLDERRRHEATLSTIYRTRRPRLSAEMTAMFACMCILNSFNVLNFDIIRIAYNIIANHVERILLMIHISSHVFLAQSKLSSVFQFSYQTFCTIYSASN